MGSFNRAFPLEKTSTVPYCCSAKMSRLFPIFKIIFKELICWVVVWFFFFSVFAKTLFFQIGVGNKRITVKHVVLICN